MPRPTRAAIRAFLDDLGLNVVDTEQWFRSVLPEIIVAAVDLGRIEAPIFSTRHQVITHTTPAATVNTISLETPAGGFVNVISNLNVNFSTGNIDQIRFHILDGAAVNTYWQDIADVPPFPTGTYLGDGNQRTASYNAIIGSGRLIIRSDDGTFQFHGAETWQAVLVSAGAVVKTAVYTYRVDSYRIEDFPGW